MIRVAIEVVRRKLERALKVKQRRLVEAKDDVTGRLVGSWVSGGAEARLAVWDTFYMLQIDAWHNFETLSKENLYDLA